MKLEFIIQNTTDKPKSAVLLGYNENFLRMNFGSDDGIEITCLQDDFTQVSYQEVVAQLGNIPSCIKSVMFESYYIKNKELHVSYVHRNVNGYVQHLPVTLTRNKKHEVPLLFDGNTSINISSPPNSKIMFIVNDGKQKYSESEMDRRRILLK